MLFDEHNSVQRQILRGDLRVRLGEIAPMKFFDLELNHWLMQGQYEVQMAFKGISNLFYGERDVTNPTISSYECDLSSISPAVSEVVKVRVDISDTWYFVKRVEPKEFEGYAALGATGNFYDVANDPAGFYMHQGQKLHFTHIASAIATKVDLYYIAKPTEPSADTDYIFCPEEFHDLVVLYALTKAFQKLGTEANPEQRAEVEQDIANRVKAVRWAYRNEPQAELLRKAMSLQGK
jgi:hypothetical protein